MLEIHVFDQVKIADNLKEAKRYIMHAVREWYKSDVAEPLKIEVRKIEDRGPPTLSINVNEEVITETAFG